jgi:hypothetical protein
MKNINDIKFSHDEELEKQARKHGVSFISIQKLLQAEKTKKLLKRNALIQQNIDKEITNSFGDED